MEVLKVSAKSVPNSVAGAGATNQAVKAIAIARGYLAPAGMDLVCVPTFGNIVINDEERTAIRLIVERK